MVGIGLLGAPHHQRKELSAMQKTVVIGLVIACLIGTPHAQVRDAEGYTLEDVKAKSASFRRMQITGLSLLGLGVGGVAGGIALMASAEWESHSSPGGVSVSTEDPQGGAGLALMAMGIPMTVAGTVLSAIGGRKYVEYKRRAASFAGYDPAGKGVRGWSIATDTNGGASPRGQPNTV
jgi:hypothetical protein